MMIYFILYYYYQAYVKIMLLQTEGGSIYCKKLFVNR